MLVSIVVLSFTINGTQVLYACIKKNLLHLNLNLREFFDPIPSAFQSHELNQKFDDYPCLVAISRYDQLYFIS